MSPGTVAALCGFAFLASFTDAVVGGGGLIQLPALLVFVPHAPLPTIFGTHKAAATTGTMAAVARYARGLRIEWRVTVPAAIASFTCSLLGAHAVSAIDPTVLRPLILALLIIVAVITWRARDFGTVHLPRLAAGPALATAVLIGAVLGFYDGFFGPGTGTFLIFAFVGLFIRDAFQGIKIEDSTSLASNLIYFSFVTLTSTGYGDILPVHPIARSLCNVETIVGQLYPATLLARLVSLQLESRK